MRKTNINTLLKANQPEGIKELIRIPNTYWRYNLNDVSLYNDNTKAKALQVRVTSLILSSSHGDLIDQTENKRK